MRGDRFLPDAISHFEKTGRTKWRAAPVRFTLCDRTGTGLKLGCATLLIWLLMPRNVPESRPARRIRGTSEVAIRRIAFGPDGQTIATIDDRCCVKLRQAGDGPFFERALDVQGGARALAISPDGRFLAIGREEPDVVLCRLDGDGTRARPGGSRPGGEPHELLARRAVAGRLELLFQ